MLAESELLILLTEANGLQIEAIDTTIARLGGRVVAGFLPYALIIQVPEKAVKELHQSFKGNHIYNKAVGTGSIEDAIEPIRSILVDWNQRRSASDSHPSPRGRDLPWDAPGFLPPDPPPEIRKMLRGREQRSKPDDSPDM